MESLPEKFINPPCRLYCSYAQLAEALKNTLLAGVWLPLLPGASSVYSHITRLFPSWLDDLKLFRRRKKKVQKKKWQQQQQQQQQFLLRSKVLDDGWKGANVSASLMTRVKESPERL